MAASKAEEPTPFLFTTSITFAQLHLTAFMMGITKHVAARLRAPAIFTQSQLLTVTHPLLVTSEMAAIHTNLPPAMHRVVQAQILAVVVVRLQLIVVEVPPLILVAMAAPQARAPHRAVMDVE